MSKDIDRIAKGSITLDVSHGHRSFVLRTPTDGLCMQATELDDAIEALCTLRQLLDPLTYDELLARVTPRVVVSEPVLTFRDLPREHAGIASPEGRVSCTVVDDLDER